MLASVWIRVSATKKPASGRRDPLENPPFESRIRWLPRERCRENCAYENTHLKTKGAVGFSRGNAD